MLVIVLGSNGMLGSYIYAYLSKFYKTITIDRIIMDALYITKEEIQKILKKCITENSKESEKMDNILVINCIGIIPQRNSSIENNQCNRKYIRVNTLFPHLLADCCEVLGCKMVHVSTDCVYTGNQGNYIEDDEHDETNIYGVSKSLGEPQNCCVIRTSIIGEEQQNKKSLLEWIRSKNGKEINGFINHHWNGITCLQLAKIIQYMVQNNIFWDGVRHIHSPNSLTKYELVKIIIQVYNLDITVNVYESNTINKTLASKYVPFINIPNIYEQIVDMYNFSITK